MDLHEELSVRDIEVLFRPFRSRALDLPTRVVMAPMTRCFSPGGVPTQEVAEYYKRRAQNEVGLIVTEGTLVNEPAAGNAMGVPNFYGGAALRAWKKVVEAVHTTDAKIAPQLWHVGLARKLEGDYPNPEAAPIGPSGIDPESLEKVAAPMSRAKIEEVVGQFAQSALDAKKLNFDAVEIHGAHGYLIDQFFWDKTNLRTDEYGGDLVGRTRFACDVVRAVREAVGRSFPILFRFSQWKVGHYDVKLAQCPQELEAFLAPLAEAGVDVFDCSTRRYWEPEFEGSPLNLAGWTKRLTGLPTISVGSVGLDKSFTETFGGAAAGVGHSCVDPLIKRMRDEEFDLIAVGRALLADPAWAAKMHSGRVDEIDVFSEESLSRLS